MTNKINQLSAVGLKPEVAMVQSELEAAESRNRHLVVVSFPPFLLSFLFAEQKKKKKTGREG